MIEPLRLAVGLLTILPVRPPAGTVDRGAAGSAMLLAPLVGLLLATAVGVLGWAAAAAGCPPLLVAALGVSALALLTRGLHLDGLADTADGLGSGKGAHAALEVMRRSDIGPFGVATLVLVLLVQVAAAADLLTRGHGLAALLGIVVGRLALPLGCRQGMPPARREGLGAMVVGTVPPGWTVVASVVTIASVVAAAAVEGQGPHGALGVAGSAVCAVVAAEALLRHCVRRFEGVTGDVLGAGLETAQAAYLVVLAAVV